MSSLALAAAETLQQPELELELHQHQHQHHLRVKIKFTDGHKLHLRVKPWCTIKDVKDQLSARENIPTQNMRIFFRGAEVGNTWPLTLQEDKTALFCVIEPKGMYSAIQSPSSSRVTVSNDIHHSLRRTVLGHSHFSRASLQIRGTASDCAPVLVEAMREAQRGLQNNLKPKLADVAD